MLDKDYCWKGAKKIKKNESVFVILNIAMPSRWKSAELAVEVKCLLPNTWEPKRRITSHQTDGRAPKSDRTRFYVFRKQRGVDTGPEAFNI